MSTVVPIMHQSFVTTDPMGLGNSGDIDLALPNNAEVKIWHSPGYVPTIPDWCIRILIGIVNLCSFINLWFVLLMVGARIAQSVRWFALRLAIYLCCTGSSCTSEYSPACMNGWLSPFGLRWFRVAVVSQCTSWSYGGLRWYHRVLPGHMAEKFRTTNLWGVSYINEKEIKKIDLVCFIDIHVEFITSNLLETFSIKLIYKTHKKKLESCVDHAGNQNWSGSLSQVIKLLKN